METTNNNNSQTCKIFFGNDVRRISLNLASLKFTHFQKHLQTIFGPVNYHSSIALQYQDEEGDKITINSEIEWREAVDNCFASQKIIRFFLVELANFNNKLALDANHLVKKNKKCKNENMKEKKCCQEAKAKQQTIIENNFLPFFAEALPELVEILREKEISGNLIESWLKQVVDFKVASSSSNSIEMNLNISSIIDYFKNQAYHLLEINEENKARLIYEAILMFTPHDSHCLYNLACAESLLDEKENALEHLELAIENGYRDVDHISQDSDLKNISKEPKFIELINKLKPNIVPPTKSSVNNEQQQQQQQQQNEFALQIQELKAMGFNVSQENLEILVEAFQGDMTRIVSTLLDNLNN